MLRKKRIVSSYRNWLEDERFRKEQERNAKRLNNFIKPHKHNSVYLDWLKREVKKSSLPSIEKRIILDLFYKNPYDFIQPLPIGVVIQPRDIIEEYRKKAEARHQTHNKTLNKDKSLL